MDGISRASPLPRFGRPSFQAMPMSRVPWHLFQDRQPRAHLIVGALVQADGPVGGDELTAIQSVLTRLVRKHVPAGNYAATVVRDTGRPEVYFAFDDETDARTFTAAVKAEAIESHSGWASRWVFEVDSARLAELEASLPPPRTSPRRGKMDQSPLARRVRRGPWTPISHDD
jgi:hypothetical protein